MYMEFLIVSRKEGRFGKTLAIWVQPQRHYQKESMDKTGFHLITTFKFNKHCQSSCIRWLTLCSEKCTEVCIPHALQPRRMVTPLPNCTEQSAASESINETNDLGNKSRDSLGCVSRCELIQQTPNLSINNRTSVPFSQSEGRPKWNTGVTLRRVF